VGRKLRHFLVCRFWRSFESQIWRVGVRTTGAAAALRYGAGELGNTLTLTITIGRSCLVLLIYV
jgi:hypothetical protein